MRQNPARGTGLLLIVLVLAACAGTPESVRSAPPVSIAQSTVGLLPINTLPDPDVDIGFDPLAFVPYVGRVSSVVRENAKQRRLTARYAEDGYDYARALDAYLGDALRSVARELIRVDAVRERGKADGEVKLRRFFRRPPESSVPYLVDVYVDEVGFFARRLGEPYSPAVKLGVRVTGPRGGVVMQDVFSAQGEVEFEDFEDVLTRAEASRQALDAVLEEVAAAVAQALAAL